MQSSDYHQTCIMRVCNSQLSPRRASPRCLNIKAICGIGCEDAKVSVKRAPESQWLFKGKIIRERLKISVGAGRKRYATTNDWLIDWLAVSVVNCSLSRSGGWSKRRHFYRSEYQLTKNFSLAMNPANQWISRTKSGCFRWGLGLFTKRQMCRLLIAHRSSSHSTTVCYVGTQRK